MSGCQTSKSGTLRFDGNNLFGELLARGIVSEDESNHAPGVARFAWVQDVVRIQELW
jgi:hypothetical protein